jgi:hypothetical protein
MAPNISVRILLAALVLTALGLAAAPGPALASPGHALHQRCVSVEATGVGQDLGGGRTTATVTVAGITVGTTAATFTVTGVEGSLVSFVGPIVFTGLGGTLTADVTGSLDTATGDFTSTSDALTGTGALSGVTGHLTFTGHEDLTTGTFTETISGELCAPVPGRRG